MQGNISLQKEKQLVETTEIVFFYKILLQCYGKFDLKIRRRLLISKELNSRN